MPHSQARFSKVLRYSEIFQRLFFNTRNQILAFDLNPKAISRYNKLITIKSTKTKEAYIVDFRVAGTLQDHIVLLTSLEGASELLEMNIQVHRLEKYNNNLSKFKKNVLVDFNFSLNVTEVMIDDLTALAVSKDLKNVIVASGNNERLLSFIRVFSIDFDSGDLVLESMLDYFEHGVPRLSFINCLGFYPTSQSSTESLLFLGCTIDKNITSHLILYEYSRKNTTLVEKVLKNSDLISFSRFVWHKGFFYCSDLNGNILKFSLKFNIK